MTHQTDITESGDVPNYLTSSKKEALLSDVGTSGTKTDGDNFIRNYTTSESNTTVSSSDKHTDKEAHTKSFTDISSGNKKIKIVRYRLEKEKMS